MFVVNPPANIVEPVTDKFDANCVLLFNLIPSIASRFILNDAESEVLPDGLYSTLIPAAPTGEVTAIPDELILANTLELKEDVTPL